MPATFLTERRKSILLIVFAGLGGLGLLARAGYLAVTGITSFTSGATTGLDDLSSGVLGAAGMLFCLLPLAAMIYDNSRQLQARTLPAGHLPPVKLWQVFALGFIWLMILLLGSLLTTVWKYGWAPLAVVFPLGVALPAMILAWVAGGGLISSGTRRRLVSVFGIALVGSTTLAIAAEYLVVLLGVLVLGLSTLVHPEWRSLILQLKDQVSNASDVQAIVTLLAPYLSNPLVLLTVLAFVAGIGPMIEEAFKPLAVWLVGRRLQSPAEGFALGALSGAAFALLEGLTAASGAPNQWGIGIGGRAFSSLMHITASGIVGWGIASALVDRKPLRLAGAYITAVLIHGLWNGSVVLLVYGGLQSMLTPGQQVDFASGMLMLAGLGAILLLLGVVILFLPLFNRKLRPAVPDLLVAAPATPAPSEPPAGETPAHPE